MRGRKCENALELRGKRAPAEFPGQAIARESTLAQGDGVMGALGCTQRTRGSRRVGSALEWQGGATCTVEETCARDRFSFAGSPTGEEGGSEKPWKQRLRVKSALGEEALNLHCAKKCRERDVRVRVEVRRAPWRRRATGTARRQRECAVSTLGVEEKVIARANTQGQVRRRRAFVWRRERSGHDRVCAGYAGR